MITIHNQIKRLSDIHSRCMDSNNLNNYLDLAHCLRIISEYREKINEVLPEGVFFESELIISEINKFSKKAKMILLPIKPRVIHKSVATGTFFFVGSGTITDDQAKIITSPSHNFHKQKYSFDKFWGSQVLFVRRIKEGPLTSISRLNLVQRVANTLGASHKFTVLNNTSNEEDIIIYQLYKEIRILGIPLPFFICYKISQEILSMYRLNDQNKH